MDANQSDDETLEFEIEVVSSSSSASLISANRECDEPVIHASAPHSGADCEEAQETYRTQPDQISEQLSPVDLVDTKIQDCNELEKPVDDHEEQVDAKINEVADVKQADDSTDKQQPWDELEEPKVKEEPIESQADSLDQETIPAEASEAPTSSNNDQESHDCLEAPNEKSVTEESEGALDLNIATVGNQVLRSDLSKEDIKSLQEQAAQLELVEATITGEAAVEEAPSQQATKYLFEQSTELAPCEQQLVSEINRCPDGWLFVDDPAELQLLSVIEWPQFTTSNTQPLAPQDAADNNNSCQPVEAHTDATKSNDLTVNRPIDRQEGLLADQEEARTGPGGEQVQEQELVQHQIVDISIELTSSACEAPKAPHVIILNDAGDGFSDLDSPISMDRQVCSHDDEYDSLGDRDDEEEDLEREFDEEPEFEARQVVVKRNKNPRDEYEMGAELGRGRFGTVMRCTEQASGRQLAAKFIAMRRREDREDVEREVAIMSVLQHKRLLQLYDAFDDGQFEMCLITELVEGGELFERIVDDDFELTEKKAAIFMRQICEGVEYMHSQQIVHLDMKPENILCLSRTGNRIKLIDFGLARRLDPKNPIRVMFGTPDFAAPEVLGYEMVTLNTDMWSVGVICYVLLSGLSPFMGENDMDTMANVTRATYDFNDQAFEPISDLAKDFISKLLLRNPTDRLKPNECLKHAWLAKGGAQLEAAVRERRSSTISLLNQQLFGERSADMTPPSATALQRHRPSFGGESTTSSGLVSLDKRRLKRYVVKRKWHKTVHAIMALNRMGANLNKFTE